MKWFSPATLAETYRDPVAWLILAVDLFPVYAILQFGWDAAPLVFLYWLENLVVGAITLLRMLLASVKDGAIGALGMVFMGPFFLFHYGMFCFVHGIFLAGFASSGPGVGPSFSLFGLVEFALSTGAQMGWFLTAIIALQLFLFLRDFVLRGQWKEADVTAEMGKPYGRIVVLHVALFAGFAAMIALGQPLVGVLFLILLRALWGIYQTVRRRLQLDGEMPKKVDEVSLI